ncbi:hypothetical protein [Halapricum hydrolyticum]|uniref:Uncharacterized protein n=1 Tax=Halapricum hydrolyticum TaxID=2979991 RepID=A0AAE3LHX4_9EURY|nr:hypothetical protein [Halapricum hydrolyticum]MCU4716722.1 hypothetical protein [Halapricum hydrolyticum]MCU4725673.1 hypothetical protein [Halapricum hydrolyticum]
MSAANRTGLVGAIQIDLKRLHETWMELIYPRQLEAEQTVLGKWRPQTTGSRIAYQLWAAIGAPVVGLFYPLVLLGYVLRYQASKIDSAATRVGILGVVVLSVVVWGALSVLAQFQLEMSTTGVVAVVAAGVVATVSAVLAILTSRVGGRVSTVLVSYPLAITAIFLPPVVAALYSQQLAEVVFPRSESLAIWLLDNVLTVADINTYLRENYTLQGPAYVGMWFGIAVPIGWVLGTLVTLANYVRPRD